MSDFDVIVIGAGPGGYVCAIKAAQLGMKVACIDKRDTLGGTCLNIGCIPSKALLHASEVYAQASHTMSRLGVQVQNVSLDLNQMMKHKSDTVDSLTKGISFLLKKNGVEAIHGVAQLLSPQSVQVNLNNGEIKKLNAKNIVIATGSDVATLPNVVIDEKNIVSSTGALSFDTVPSSLAVIGGGVIGLEMASIWSRLGAKVTVIEYADKIAGGVDGEIAVQFQKILEKQGILFKTSTTVTDVVPANAGFKLSLARRSGGETDTLEAEKVLVSIGRKPYTDGLGLKEIGVDCDSRGRIVTNHRFETNIKGIYAIGDVIAGPMLAHKAEEDGIALAECLAGQAGHVNYDLVSGVIYTEPEVAFVGKTEEALKEQGIEYNVGKFSFMANGKAKASLHTDGFVKILSDKYTDRILGVHMIGHGVGNMIAEACLAMEFKASAEDLARTCHAHPTLSEAVKEAACAAAFGRAIHS